jgi:hypothetical protein
MVSAVKWPFPDILHVEKELELLSSATFKWD